MTSFIKLKKNNSIIPGTKTSLRSGQVIASTGNAHLDHILDGGLGSGSLLLLGEDKYNKYARVLTKYFLAEGIARNHRVFYANLDNNPNEFMKELPVALEDDSDANKPASENEDLRIAWRYNSVQQVDSEQKSSYLGKHFDLSKKHDFDPTSSQTTLFSYHDYLDQKNPEQKVFDVLFDRIQEFSKSDGSNLSRICINSIGSPLWYSQQTYINDLLKFVVKLKAIARYTDNTICFLTIPLHLVEAADPQLTFKIRNVIDFQLDIQSFDESNKEDSVVFKEYNGLIHIKKLQPLNSLQSLNPETFDLAFKLKRNKFIIEKFHLPPELEDSEQREQDEVGCGKKSLDF